MYKCQQDATRCLRVPTHHRRDQDHAADHPARSDLPRRLRKVAARGDRRHRRRQRRRHSRPAAPLLAIEAGGEHTCAIRFGALICWGSNEALQVGAPPSDSVERHHPPRRIIDAGVTALAVGAFHTCAVHLSAVKCWGANSNSQLGFTYTYLAPQTVPLASLAEL